MKTATKLIIMALIYTSISAHAQLETLVVDSSNILSSVITVATNQYAVVESADYDDGGLLLLNMQGISFTKNFSFESVDGLTISGPATIQLEAAPNAYYSSYATIKIETPCVATVVSNYVPADAIVIPASATGNVQIILESSPDLVNWTAANPGTYGASAGTNRFFRVVAVTN